MKKYKGGLVLAAALAAVVLLGRPAAPASVYHAPSKCTNSESHPLCRGIQAHFNFEETTTVNTLMPRFDTFSLFSLHEAPGVGYVANGATAKCGSKAAVFFGTPSYGFRTETDLMSGNDFTVAVWIYNLDTAGTANNERTLFSREYWQTIPAQRGNTILLHSTGSVWQPAIWGFASVGSTADAYTQATAITPNAWHLLVFTSSTYQFGKNEFCISVDGAVPTCQANTYYHMYGGKFLDIGFHDGNPVGSQTMNPFHGYLDGLVFAARPWDQFDIAAYYNSGTCKQPPF